MAAPPDPDNYTPRFPNPSSSLFSPTQINKLQSFIRSFYATSDDRSKDEEWVDFFAADAMLVMGDKTARGTREIRELRRKMWDDVRSRQHRPLGVYPASFLSKEKEGGGGGGKEAEGEAEYYEYMIYGSLDLVMEQDGGRNLTKTWAARAVLKKEEEEDVGGGRLRYTFYQVYI